MFHIGDGNVAHPFQGACPRRYATYLQGGRGPCDFCSVGYKGDTIAALVSAVQTIRARQGDACFAVARQPPQARGF